MPAKSPLKAKEPPKSNVIRLADVMFSPRKVAAAVGVPEEVQEQLPEEDEEKIVVMWLNEADIDDNRFQPRTTYKPKKMAELRESMEAHGQIQTAVVRWNEETGRYEFAVGHRRRIVIRSGVNVGPKKKPQYAGKIRCEIRVLTDLQMRLFAIEENDAREDMNAIDRARAYMGIFQECLKLGAEITWGKVAEIAGMGYRQMHRVVELLNLPKRMIDALETDKLNAAHGAALLEMNEPAYAHLLGTLYRTTLDMGLSGAACAKLGKRLRQRFLSGDDQLALTAVSEEWEAQARAEAQRILDEREANRAAGQEARKATLQLVPGGAQPNNGQTGTPPAEGTPAPTGDNPPRQSGGQPSTSTGGSGQGGGGGSRRSVILGGGGSPPPSDPPRLFGDDGAPSDGAHPGASDGEENGAETPPSGMVLEPPQRFLARTMGAANSLQSLVDVLEDDPEVLVQFRESPEFEAAKTYFSQLHTTLERVDRLWRERLTS